MSAMFKRMASSVLAIAGAALAAQIVSTSPALANPGADGYCTPPHELCVYRLFNYVDMQADYIGTDNDFRDDSLWYWDGDEMLPGAETVENRTSSARNLDTSCTAVLWQFKDFGGEYLVMYPQTAYGDLRQQAFDNKASSVSWGCP
ncbi:hypothetical protein ACBI99_36925 [Nonomuraea sp. ATR24]|uniref:hypothetical protein n=1 Tax=Nonomuraea TaxID=83681 RepID=UPI001C5F4BFD|nr:hypothetical protein [Nonomuraea ceibae]